LAPALSGPLAANSTSIARRGSQLWIYNTSDLSSQLCTAGYFTDGKALGMGLGDIIQGVCWTTQSSTGCVTFMGALFTTNSTAGWNLSTDTMITSTFG
jgi:hypothetical protein